MKHDMHVSNNAEDYTDVDVTITNATGEQFLFTVSRDNTSNTMLDDDEHVSYSESEEADFNIRIIPPLEVMEFFKTIRQAAVDMMPPNNK